MRISANSFKKARDMKMTQFKTALVRTSVFLLAACLFIEDATSGEKSDFAKAADFIREKQFVEAFDIFVRLAEAHDHDAQFNTAVLLRKGIGRPSNYPEALKWAWLAELGGNLRAAELRAELIDLIPEEELDKVRDQVKAVLQSRMDAGDSLVILQIADFYLNVLAEPDYKNAYALRSLAAAVNIKAAGSLRDEIEPELEPKDLVEAQTIAKKLFTDRTWVLETPKK